MARSTQAQAQSLGFAARIGAWVDSPTLTRRDGAPRKEFLALDNPRAAGETARLAVFDANGTCYLALKAINTPSAQRALVEALRAALTLAENYTPTDADPAPKAPKAPAAPKDPARSNGPVTVIPVAAQAPQPARTSDSRVDALEAKLDALLAALGQAPTPAPASPAPTKARKSTKLDAATVKEEFAF